MRVPYKVVTRINDEVYRIQRSLKSRMVVVHLVRLAPYQGAARDERPWGGSSWRMNTAENRDTGGRWDRSQTSHAQASEKKKWRYVCRLFGTNNLKEGAMWRIDPLLRGDSVNNSHCYGAPAAYACAVFSVGLLRGYMTQLTMFWRAC
jgi:hypothetical protein